MKNPTTVTKHGAKYVLVPQADYRRLIKHTGLAGAVDAVEFARAVIGKNLKAAREEAGLTQVELAEMLNVTQPLVSGAESGRERVGERYAERVYEICERIVKHGKRASRRLVAARR